MNGAANVNGTSLFYETSGTGFRLKPIQVIRYDVRGIGKPARPESAFSHSEDLYALLTLALPQSQRDALGGGQYRNAVALGRT